MGEKTQNVRERKERERARAHLDRSLALLAPSFPCLGSKTVFSSSFLARLGSTFVRVVAFFSSSFSVPKRVVFSRLLSLSLSSPLSPRTHPRLAGLAPRHSFLASLSFARSPLSRVGLKSSSLKLEEKEFKRNSSLGGSLGFSVIEIQEKIKCSKNNTSRVVTNTYRV